MTTPDIIALAVIGLFFAATIASLAYAMRRGFYPKRYTLPLLLFDIAMMIAAIAYIIFG